MNAKIASKTHQRWEKGSGVRIDHSSERLFSPASQCQNSSCCEGDYNAQTTVVEASNQIMLTGKKFQILKLYCLLLRTSHHSHDPLKKVLGMVPWERTEDLNEIWRNQPLRYKEEKLPVTSRDNKQTEKFQRAMPTENIIDSVRAKMLKF